MTVLLYAVTKTSGTLAGHGLDARPLREIIDGDLTAIVSDHDETPPPTEPNLWAYEHIIEQLMAATAVVPARFGATAEGDEDVRTMLTARHDELSSALARLAGTVEFAVHTAATRPDAASTAVRTSGHATGTDYMLTRLTEQRRASEITRRLGAAVKDVVLASKTLAHAPDRLAYLVRHDDVDAFVARVISVNDPDISWTGPWPPYSFTSPGEAR